MKQNPYTSSQCSKSYDSESALKRHNSCVRNPNSSKWICYICNKKFNQKQSLDRHKFTHTDLKDRPSYDCSICKRKFLHKANVTRHHQLIHVDPKDRPSYDCIICSKKFVQKESLTRHSLTHDRRIIFKCTLNQCNRSYSSRDNLNRHVRTCHELN
jgi:uncharacterized Zn-finger protein